MLMIERWYLTNKSKNKYEQILMIERWNSMNKSRIGTKVCHTIVGNGSSSINMNNFHNIFPSYSVVWISLSHRAFDIFLCVNIGPATPIFIYRDPDSVSWWLQNSKKMSLSPYIGRITKIFSSNLVEYIYSWPIDPLMYFSLLILVQLHQFSLLVTQI